MNAENEYRKRKGTRKMKMKKLLNNMMKLMIGAVLFLAAPAMESAAAEYSVTPQRQSCIQMTVLSFCLRDR